MSMSALAIHVKMAEHVLMESTDTFAIVCPDLLENSVKQTSMNVPVVRASTVERAAMESTDTSVPAYLDLLELTVN